MSAPSPAPPDGSLATAGTADLAAVLANRRWQRRTRPFPHVVTENVFVPSFARRLVGDFERALEAAGYDTSHDFVGATLRRGGSGALDLFLSPAWHALAAGVFGVQGRSYLTAGIHRHRPGSRDGFPHNDIYPERLHVTAMRAGPQGEVLADRTTDVDAPPGDRQVRAVAMLYYLGEDAWRPGDGGETGLYWDWKDPVGEPVRRMPPRSNTLFAFACHPHSYHSFISNHRRRDSVIVFLYRDVEDYVAHWGEEGLQQYADFGGRDV
jgi:hypothetical protein